MKYAWIGRHKKQWRVTLQCEVLDVSASGYFEHQRRKGSVQPATLVKLISDEALLIHIKAAHAGSKGECGWPRIWQEPRANGVKVGKEHIQRLMKLARPGLIFHSDRGSQYCSRVFQQTLGEYGMQSSMSRKGNCWDNAPTESFWKSLKVGRLYGMRFETRRYAMDEVLDWLMLYNHRRLHSTLGYISPMRFA